MKHNLNLYIKIWGVRNPFWMSVAKITATLFFMVIFYLVVNAITQHSFTYNPNLQKSEQLSAVEILLASASPEAREEGERRLLVLAEGGSDDAKLRLAKLYSSEPLLAKKWLLKVGNSKLAQPLIAQIDEAVLDNSFDLGMVDELAHVCDRELAGRNKAQINKAEEVSLVLMRLFCPLIYPDKGDVRRALEELNEQGNHFAAFYLGRLYLDGLEVSHDPVKGKAYLELACKRGIKKACEMIPDSSSGSEPMKKQKDAIIKELKQIEKQLRNLAE